MQGEIDMADKTNFWAVFVVPWAGKNPYKIAFWVFIFACVLFYSIWVVDYLRGGQSLSIAGWLFFSAVILSVVVMVILLIVRWLVARISRTLPEGALIRSDCIVVHGILEMPGLVQISDDQLVIMPLVGTQILVSMGEISDISEYRWYNGRPYLGKTKFFKLIVSDRVSDKWRLGFGVEDGARWRNLLCAQNSHT